MSELKNGLRFDIFERVHLPDGVAGIQVLEDVELVPQIQVIAQGEQAVLKGNLWLTGSYVGDGEDAGRSLEHLIPVEITLPMNRVRDVVDITVEIENFDVDLLSSRSLNVTGVLSLNGIEIAGDSSDQWRSEEETVFVHEPSQVYSQSYEALNQRVEDGASKGEEQQEQEEPVMDYGLAVESGYLQAQPPVEDSAEETEQAEEVLSAEDLEDQQFEPLRPVEAAIAEKKEMKIAFGSKDSTRQAEAVALTSLVHSGSGSRRNTAANRRSAEPEPEQTEKSSKRDALEWKNLFLSSDEGVAFRKVRMCIVQKAETLDSIASRYKINAREIALFNRLNEQAVSEGQVLYIP